MLVSRGPLPSGPGLAYEVKWDGIRGQVALHDGAVTVRSRPGRDCSESFPELGRRLASTAVRAWFGQSSHAVVDVRVIVSRRIR